MTKDTVHKLTVARKMIKPGLVTVIMAITSTSFAVTSDETAYADSVLQWGAWELDIEPAAGGLQPPQTQALNARGTNLRLRTNSISALEPRLPAATPPARGPEPIPPLPVVVPGITPISPNVPIPNSAPNDGF